MQPEAHANQFNYQRIEWRPILNEALQPGDFWANRDPNKLTNPDQPVSLQSVHPNTYGLNPSENNPMINLGNGGYWRPTTIITHLKDIGDYTDSDILHWIELNPKALRYQQTSLYGGLWFNSAHPQGYPSLKEAVLAVISQPGNPAGPAEIVDI